MKKDILRSKLDTIKLPIDKPDTKKSPETYDKHYLPVLEELGVRTRADIDKLREKGVKCVVLDVPIPVNRFVSLCNQIWVVTCDEKIRLERLKERGMDIEDAKRRIAMQMTDEEYMELGDYGIDNSGSIEETIAQIDKLIVKELNGRGIRT